MTAQHYRRLYGHAELHAVHLIRCASAGRPLLPAADEAMALLAAQHPPLTAHDAALATVGALARLSYAALRAAAPDTREPAADRWPPVAPCAPVPEQVRAITAALDRHDWDLLAVGAHPHGHTSVELARLAMAEQLPTGRPLHESALGPLVRALAHGPTPHAALMSVLSAAVELALSCLCELVVRGAPGQGDEATLARLLDDFELHKVTHTAGTAPA
ncbi:hypothetical protein BOQ63_000340 (plasmid) [Streptomyces viridifaciens]|nr:hypothetical protein BOQ63_000340 [Streptomyces viridifaciens]